MSKEIEGMKNSLISMPEEMLWKELKDKWRAYEKAKKENNIQDMEKHLKEIGILLWRLGILSPKEAGIRKKDIMNRKMKRKKEIIEKIKNKTIEGVKCEVCGRRFRCEEHGFKYIKKILDSFDNPVYFCEKCVIEYKTVFGAIVHMHNPFEEHANEFEEALKEFLNKYATHEQ
jgi:hypothetical protein